VSVLSRREVKELKKEGKLSNNLTKEMILSYLQQLQISQRLLQKMVGG
jgi:hypothetical protein